MEKILPVLFSGLVFGITHFSDFSLELAHNRHGLINFLMLPDFESQDMRMRRPVSGSAQGENEQKCQKTGFHIPKQSKFKASQRSILAVVPVF